MKICNGFLCLNFYVNNGLVIFVDIKNEITKMKHVIIEKKCAMQKHTSVEMEYVMAEKKITEFKCLNPCVD